jgi:hypothetical protein
MYSNTSKQDTTLSTSTDIKKYFPNKIKINWISGGYQTLLCHETEEGKKCTYGLDKFVLDPDYVRETHTGESKAQMGLFRMLHGLTASRQQRAHSLR